MTGEQMDVASDLQESVNHVAELLLEKKLPIANSVDASLTGMGQIVIVPLDGRTESC